MRSRAIASREKQGAPFLRGAQGVRLSSGALENRGADIGEHRPKPRRLCSRLGFGLDVVCVAQRPAVGRGVVAAAFPNADDVVSLDAIARAASRTPTAGLGECVTPEPRAGRTAATGRLMRPAVRAVLD